MCQIIVKPVGKKFNMSYMDKAQGWNEDGYGVSWWEDEQIHTFKTMNFKRFKAILSTLKGHKAIAHLRNTTRGITCVDNNHPFDIPSGKLFHNGTMSSLTSTTKGGSDTLALAELISNCDYRYVEDIMPFIEQAAGTTLNKLVFFEDDGRITFVNKHLGKEEDGIWYSNDYHLKSTKRKDQYKHSATGGKVTYVLNEDTGLYQRCVHDTTATGTKKENKKVTSKQELTKVFVYGTLKRGFANHKAFLSEATYVGSAKSVSKWIMIGEGKAFPYLLTKDHDKGKIVYGEVYEVNTRQLGALDSLEGVAVNHYKHDSIYVTYLDGGTSENVTVYTKGIVTEADKSYPYISSFGNKQIPLVS